MALGTPGSLYAGYDHGNTGLPYPEVSRDGYDVVFEEEAQGRGFLGHIVLEAAPSEGARSSLDVDFGNTDVNEEFTVTAVARGEAGDDITFEIIDPDGETAHVLPIVTVDGTAIVVLLAEDDSTNLSTAAEVVAAINSDPAANLLVMATLAGTGAEPADAFAEANLADGADGTYVSTPSLAFVPGEGIVDVYLAATPVTPLNDGVWQTILEAE